MIGNGGKRPRLVSEYSAEILGYTLELERAWRRPGDYLASHPEIELWAHDKLVKWVADVCKELRTSAHTLQLALTILSIFLSKVHTPKSVLQLVGVVSVLITAKFQEGIPYTLELAYNQCAKQYQKKDIITAELYCLEKLDWRLYYPTAAEILRQLIYVTNVDYDFTRIITRADEHCLVCYLDYHLSLYSPLSLAIVCTVASLEQFKQTSFRNQWLQFLYLKVQLKVEELDECKAAFQQKLETVTPDKEKQLLKLVSRSSFSALLAQAHLKHVAPR